MGALWTLVTTVVTGLVGWGTSQANAVNQGARRRVRSIAIMAGMVLAVPAVFFTVGILTGWIGHMAGSETAVEAGKFILRLGGFLGALLAFSLCIRGGLYTHVVALITRVLNDATGNRTAAIETEQVQALIGFALGWATWFTGACLYASVFPVYLNPSMALVAGTAMLLLAGVMASGWFDGPWARRGLLIGGLIILIGATMNLVAPSAMGAVSNRLNDASERIGVEGERSSAISELERQADRGRTKTDLGRLRQIRAEQQAILDRAADPSNSCRELFCSDADRARYGELEELARQIQERAYEDARPPAPAKQPAAPAPAPPSQPPVPPTGSAATAPPPAFPPTPVPPTGGTKAPSRSRRGHAAHPGDDSDLDRADAILRRNGH